MAFRSTRGHVPYLFGWSEVGNCVCHSPSSSPASPVQLYLPEPCLFSTCQANSHLVQTEREPPHSLGHLCAPAMNGCCSWGRGWEGNGMGGNGFKHDQAIGLSITSLDCGSCFCTSCCNVGSSTGHGQDELSEVNTRNRGY